MSFRQVMEDIVSVVESKTEKLIWGLCTMQGLHLSSSCSEQKVASNCSCLA